MPSYRFGAPIHGSYFLNQIHFNQSLREEAEHLAVHLSDALRQVIRETDERTALPRGADDALEAIRIPLPETGCGAEAAIEELLQLNAAAGANTGGPRCFHFVIGGSTPAALAADILATAFETIAYTWVVSPVGVRMELQAIDWLKEMFGLPPSWSGVMGTGATMANFVCLSAARQWWGEQLGRDVSETGLAGMPQMPVLTSGYVHASTRKVLGMLGVGYGHIHEYSRDGFGRVDLVALEAALEALDGAPAVVIVNAGEVNAGDFDPVDKMITLARRHHCWVHVDGAFGLFARISPRIAHFVEGVEKADSVTVDGHKWLNVPYDSGYAFVRDHGLMARAFRYSADYLPGEDDPKPTPGALGPESSRRARSFAVWATLRAYGKDGHRRIVEHCLDLALHLGQQVEAAADFELMAKVQLNIVPFRYRPAGFPEDLLDELNLKLGEAVLNDGRFLVGTSKLGEHAIFRPAFSNWRTQYSDVDEFMTVLAELAPGVVKAVLAAHT
jgi:glutamate/tyrosine decarboxylase-like PLP-dependent enzyme